MPRRPTNGCRLLRLRGPKLGLLLLLRFLLCHVVPDDAPAHGTEHRVMPRIMASHATDDGAFDTARRIGGSGRREYEQRRHEKSSLTV